MELGLSRLRISRVDVVVRLSLVAGGATYASLLIASYVTAISPAFAYIGYSLNPASPPYLALGFACSVLPAALLPLRLTRPSTSILWIIYLLAYVPSMLMPLLSLARPPRDVIILVLVISAAFTLLSLVPRLPILIDRLPRLRPWLFWLAFTSLAAFLLYHVVGAHGFRLDIPSLADVYTVREEYKEVVASRLSRLGVSWIGNVLAPFLIAYGLLRRRPLLAVPALVLQAYLFSLTGFRSILFSAVLLLVLFVASTRQGRFFGANLVWGGAGLIAAAWLFDRVFETNAFTSTFVRRLITTPGMLTSWYYDFFSDNSQVRLAHSVLARWIDYPYEVSPPLLIGAEYFGRSQTYANGNFWADAFANFGFLGIFAYTAVLGCVLVVSDLVVGKNRTPTTTRLAVLLLGIPAFTLSNTALTTTLFTHGLGLALVLLFVAPREISGAVDIRARGAPLKRGTKIHHQSAPVPRLGR